VQQVVAQISWSHNTVLLDKCNAMNERLWYAKNAMENGWSRGIMSVQIESGLYERKGKALTNFKETLSDMDSDLAEETLKDPYVFDFLNLAEKVKEKDLEKALVDNIAQFLLELGKGFAFVGRQYHLNVGGDDFYIDLLFFHIELQSYVVIELKTKYFKPEHAGQLGFYLVAVDAQLKKDYHNPTIGLIICKHKNEIVVEYSLKHITNPVGVSEYKLSNSFKEKIKNSLPSVEELENGLSRLDD
jgi:predicted nuclease of restriction endonuclease-like (RecB) superfamily